MTLWEKYLADSQRKAAKHPMYVDSNHAHGVLMEEEAEYFDVIRKTPTNKLEAMKELADIAAVCIKEGKRLEGLVNTDRRTFDHADDALQLMEAAE